MIGISVYFKDFDEAYIERAAQLGIKYIFTSLHIPEEDLSNLDEKIIKLLSIANTYGIQVMPDISPMTFEKLNIAVNDYEALSKLGFTLVRLDYGLDDIDVVKEISKYFTISFNASVIDEAYLNLLQLNGIDFNRIIATHNFYPRKETALDYETFLKKNEFFKRWGIRVQAFVPGDVVRRYPLYEGLPTLECHRFMTTYASALDMYCHGNVDDIIIGDSMTSIETLSLMKEAFDQDIVTLRVWLHKEYQELINNSFLVRRDHPKSSLRLNVSRQANIPMTFTGKRIVGAITMDNYLYGRYGGEVQICLSELEADVRVNVIGYVHPDDIPLLSCIKTSTKIKFIAQ